MSGYLEICKCGHDISTHFRDPNTHRIHGCLGMRCDCPVYKDHLKPEPVIPKGEPIPDTVKTVLSPAWPKGWPGSWP